MCVVVATVPTIDPYGDIREYAVKLFENHGRGIGDKGKDNGLLILLAREGAAGLDRSRLRARAVDHRRLRRRNEPRRTWSPEFRNGRYGAGLAHGHRADRRRGSPRAATSRCRASRCRESEPGTRTPIPRSRVIIADLPRDSPAQPLRRPARAGIGPLGRRRLERLVERRRPVWRRVAWRRHSAADSAAGSAALAAAAAVVAAAAGW